MSGNYYPDKWLVVRINHIDIKSFYKVFAVWTGGYGKGDGWKLNSGITEVVDHGDGYEFKGESGSSYFCSKRTYGTSFYGESILSHLMATAPSVNSSIEILPEDTNFMELEYK